MYVHLLDISRQLACMKLHVGRREKYQPIQYCWTGCLGYPVHTCHLPIDIQQIYCSAQTGQHSRLRRSCCPVWALQHICTITCTVCTCIYSSHIFPSLPPPSSPTLSLQPVGHYTLAGVYLSLREYVAASLHLRVALHSQPAFEHAMSALRLVRCSLKFKEEQEFLKLKVQYMYVYNVHVLYACTCTCMCEYTYNVQVHAFTCTCTVHVHI